MTDLPSITELLQDAASNRGVGLRTVFPSLSTKLPVEVSERQNVAQRGPAREGSGQ